MKSYLKNLYFSFKSKLKLMIFNLFDKFEQQFCEWYYINIQIEAKDNTFTILNLPIIACCRNELYARELTKQIQNELDKTFYTDKKEITKLSPLQLDKTKFEIENQFKNNKSFPLRFSIKKASEYRPVNPQDAAAGEYIGNLNINTTYINVNGVNKDFKVYLIKPNDMHYNIMENLVCYIVKDKLDICVK